MPGTIGPFTNVPAPGDPVSSEWAQQLTQYAVDHAGGAPGVVAWTALTLVSPWTNFGSGFAPAAYRKVGDVVEVRGLVTGGGASSNIAIFPTGYVPPESLIIVTTCASGHAEVVVSSAGAMSVNAGTGTTWFSITGIWFSVTS